MFQCQACRFFRREEDRKATGLCRRHPPIVPQGLGDRFHPDLAIFPIVFDTDWCGEFEPQAPRLINQEKPKS